MEPPPAVDLELELRTRHLHVTRTRRTIWDVLVATDEHLTAEAIADTAASTGRPVGLASVYRTLDLFEDLGLVRRSRLGSAEADCWEVAHPDEHFHVVCVGCGTVDHHAGDLVALIEDHLARDHAFVTYWLDLLVTGTCASCSGRPRGD